jgi:hypothetical protein
MPSLVIRPFEPADYVALVGYPTVHGAPAFTAVIDKQVAACAGVEVFPRAPVGHAWAYIGPVAKQHGIFIARGVVRGLLEIIREHRLVRVEADTIRGWASAQRWLEWMGFEEEGVMPKRGPGGQDMVRYALFPKVAP